MAVADLQIREGPVSKKLFFQLFGPQFGLEIIEIRGGGGGGGGPGPPPPPPATSSPFLDQTETRIAEKSLKETAPLPPPPPRASPLDPPLGGFQTPSVSPRVLKGIRIPESEKILTCRIRNSGKFCSWNPES